MQHKHPLFILTPFTCNRNQYIPFPLSAPEIPDRCVPKGKTYWLCILLLLWGQPFEASNFQFGDYFIFPRTDPTRYSDVIGSYKSSEHLLFPLIRNVHSEFIGLFLSFPFERSPLWGIVAEPIPGGHQTSKSEKWRFSRPLGKKLNAAKKLKVNSLWHERRTTSGNTAIEVLPLRDERRFAVVVIRQQLNRRAILVPDVDQYYAWVKWVSEIHYSVCVRFAYHIRSCNFDCIFRIFSCLIMF